MSPLAAVPLAAAIAHGLQKQQGLLVRLQSETDTRCGLLQQFDHARRKETDVRGPYHQPRPHFAEHHHRHSHGGSNAMAHIRLLECLEAGRVPDVAFDLRRALPERQARDRQGQPLRKNVLHPGGDVVGSDPPEPSGAVIDFADHHPQRADAASENLDHSRVKRGRVERTDQQLAYIE